MGEYGDKVSQKLPWLQENLQDFHSAMCMCILDSSLQVGGGGVTGRLPPKCLQLPHSPEGWGV